MKTEEQIRATLKRNSQSDLLKLGSDKLRERVVFMSIQAAKGELEFCPKGLRDSFTTKASEAKKLSKQLSNLAKKYESGVGQGLLPEAERRKVYGQDFDKLAKKFGQVNHDEGIWVVVRNVLELAPDFEHWEALARVIAEIYESVRGKPLQVCAASRKARNTITADNLARIAKQLRQEQKERSVRPVQELLSRSFQELQTQAEKETRLLGIHKEERP